MQRLQPGDDLAPCYVVRTIVFIIGQNCPYQDEVDGKDQEARQYLAWLDQKPVATARVRFVDGYAKIERVAVLENYRGQNIGLKLMEFILADLQKENSVSKAKLGAQNYAVPFYEKLGFQALGDEYMEVGIPHRDMVLDF